MRKMKCLKKGQINRFEEKKEFNCIDYADTKHCEEYNQKAGNPDNWCKNCSFWWDNYVKFGVTYQEENPMPL